MKKQLILVMATMIACLSADTLTAAARSSTDAQKQRERAMQESFSRGRGEAAGTAVVSAKRAAAIAAESTVEEAKRKESKEEAVRRVSDAFKAELQAAVEAREKRVEESRNNECCICREFCYTDNPNVVPPCAGDSSKIVHPICKNCMVVAIKEGILLKHGNLCCPTCANPYSTDALDSIEHYTRSLLQRQPSFRALIRNRRVPVPRDVINPDDLIALAAREQAMEVREFWVQQHLAEMRRMQGEVQLAQNPADHVLRNRGCLARVFARWGNTRPPVARILSIFACAGGAVADDNLYQGIGQGFCVGVAVVGIDFTARLACVLYNLASVLRRQ